MIALFTLLSKPVRVLSRVLRVVRQISSFLQDVAMLRDPSGLLVLMGSFVLARVFKVSVSFEVVMSIHHLLRFLFILLLG